MHCFCIVFHKKKEDLTRLLAEWCDEENGRWDYACVGGRYEFTIPVSLQCKPLRLPESPTRYGDPERGGNPKLKYVSRAKVRNVILTEAGRMEDENGLSPLHPYSFVIVDYDGNEDEPFEQELGEHANLWDIFMMPRFQSWYVAAVDYHI